MNGGSLKRYLQISRLSSHNKAGSNLPHLAQRSPDCMQSTEEDDLAIDFVKVSANINLQHVREP